MAVKYYVKNADLLVQIKAYRETCKYDPVTKKFISGKMSDTLGAMILRISRGLASKGNYSGYTWVEDMIAEGNLTVCKYLHNFDPEKSNNPFAYITQICNHSFKNYIKNQKKHSIIKNAMFEKYDIQLGEDGHLDYENMEND